MTIEAIVLTGGASRRMGTDKANLSLGGTTIGRRIIDGIVKVGVEVTILGREPMEGARFQPDSAEFAGPLAAVAAFRPCSEFVFVASCDLPRFDPRIIRLLQGEVGDADAAIPDVGGRLQPLCGVYRSCAFQQARVAFDSGDRSIMAWLDRLKFAHISESRLTEAGVDPNSVLGVNTPKELKDALSISTDTLTASGS